MNVAAHQDALTGLPNRRHLYQYLEQLEDRHPESTVSLVLAGVDRFRLVNENLGHDAGDVVLAGVAQRMHEALVELAEDDEDLLLTRYAGDEFLAVLPDWPKEAAWEAADILRCVAASPEHGVTISLGVATCPGDAEGLRGLIEACDGALFAAKRDGGDQVVDAAKVADEIDSLAVTHGGFPCAQLVGRDQQLLTVQRALAGLTGNQPALVLVTGEAGSGKTRVLAAAGKTCEETGCVYLQIRSRPYDAGRPYSTLAAALDGLLRREGFQPDALLQGLTERQRSLLESLIPSLTPEGQPPTGELKLSDQDRQAILAAMEQILRNLAPEGRIALLLDDAHWIDQGSLRVAMGLMVTEGLNAGLVLAYRPEELQPSGEEESGSALGRLLADPPDGLPEPEVVELPGLASEDVDRMIRIIFPRMHVPDALPELLAERSGGNPLYVEAVLKSFLGEARIKLVARRWTLEGELTAEQLPATLQEALRGELSSADDEVREVLTNASALGTDFSLGLLKTMMGRSEEEILGALDRARKLKLVRSRSAWNDEELEFTSRSLQETSYESTSEAERASLDERAAEALKATRQELQNFAAASAIVARMAYHYGRAGRVAAAGSYASQTEAAAAQLYDAEAAPPPVRKRRQRITTADTPLDETTMGKMEEVLRYFTAAAKNIQLYPVGSRLIQRALSDLREALSLIFDQVGAFTFAANDEQLLINGLPAMRGRRGAAFELWKVLRDHHVNSVTMTRDVTDDELAIFLGEILAVEKVSFSPEYWDQLFDRHSVQNIAVDQRVYVVAGSEAAMAPVSLRPLPRGLGPEITDVVARKLDEILQSDKPFLMSSELKAELPGMLDDYLKNNKRHQVEQIAGKLLLNLSSDSPEVRRQAAGFLRETVASTEAFTRMHLSEHVQDGLIEALNVEDDGETYQELASLMQDSARNFVKAGAYDEARRIIYALRRRQSSDGGSLRIRQASIDELKRLLNSDLLDILMADLQSGQGSRQVNASKILLEFQDLAVEALIEILKESDDNRTRRMTAEVLREIGDPAYEQLKLELSLEQLEEEEFRRVTEVLDAFADGKRDVFPELKRAVHHPSRRVRAAAYRTGRRLDTQRLQEILQRAMYSDNVGVVRDAINQLGRLRVLGCGDEVLEILKHTDFDEIRKECCLALGKIQHLEAVKVLDSIISRKKRLSTGSAFSLEVRAVAAWALSQISGKQAERALERAKRDPEIKNWLRYRYEDE